MVAKSKTLEDYNNFRNILLFNYVVVLTSFSSKFLVILLPTSCKTCQDNVVFGTCGKDTVPTQVSIRIQNEVFSESAHCLLTIRLRGSAVRLIVLLNRGVIKTFAD